MGGFGSGAAAGGSELGEREETRKTTRGALSYKPYVLVLVVRRGIAFLERE